LAFQIPLKRPGLGQDWTKEGPRKIISLFPRAFQFGQGKGGRLKPPQEGLGKLTHGLDWEGGYPGQEFGFHRFQDYWEKGHH